MRDIKPTPSARFFIYFFISPSRPSGSRFADVSGLKEWKGLTWGMLPLHTSGLIACTYHIFYNSPELISLVAMQVRCTHACATENIKGKSMPFAIQKKDAHAAATRDKAAYLVAMVTKLLR